MTRGTWEKHCSNCAAYRITENAGLGYCSAFRKWVRYSLVCPHWRPR